MKHSPTNAKQASQGVPENQEQQIIDRLRELYRKNLTKSAPRAAVADYGFSDHTLLDRYTVGFSDGSLPSLLPKDKAMLVHLVSLGVLDEQEQERLSDCIIFPVDSADGRRVTLWACPKGGPSRFLLTRPRSLWNAIAAKHSAHLYVFENPIEALSVAAAGLSNIAALDAESGEPDHKAIRGWGVQTLSVIVIDTPEGVKSGNHIQARLEPLKSTLVRIPGGGSLNELFRTKGPKALADAIVAATHGLQALEIPGLEPRADGFDYAMGAKLYRVRGLQAGPQKLTAVISREQGGKLHLDKVDMLSSRSRKEFAREIVRIFQEPADHIEADLTKLLHACELRAAQPTLGRPAVPAPGTIPEADRKEGEAFGRDPRLIELILADYERFGLRGERANKLLSYLTMSSRKLKRPLAALTVAISGSGKSAIQDVTVLFCPKDEVEKVTILSGKALFHKEQNSLKQKLIALAPPSSGEILLWRTNESMTPHGFPGFHEVWTGR